MTKKLAVILFGIAICMGLAFAGGIRYANNKSVTRMKNSYILSRQTMLLRQAEQAGPVDTVIIGDSIVEGLYAGDLPGKIFVAGIGGSGVHDWQDFAPRLLDATKAGRCIIALGVNDAAMGSADAKSFAAAYSRLCAGLARHNVQLLAGTIMPVEKGAPLGDSAFDSAAIIQFNAIIKDIARKQQLEIADFYAAFADSEGMMPSGFTTDGVHLTTQSYARWKQEIINIIAR